MKNAMKRAKIIILYIIITFLLMSILSTLSAFIQGVIIVRLTFNIMETLGYSFVWVSPVWVNPILVLIVYFKIKKRIKNNSKQKYTDMEWTLINLAVILAQFAGLIMATPLGLSINKDFFMISYTGFGLWSVNAGMGATLAIMFLVIVFKALYQTLKAVLKNKKERETITGDKGVTIILLVLIVVMLSLTFTGFRLGKKLEQPPSLEKLVQDKAEYILKHKEYIETIRQYIDDIDYEELVACGECKQKIGNLDVSYHMESDGYSTLSFNAKEALENIGLKDINIVGYGDIDVEFDAKTYEVKKIYIPVIYTQTGIKNLVGGGVAWYSFDYANRPSGFILDDNWQIYKLTIAGH